MPRVFPFVFLFLLLFRTADAAEVYGAGYLCDEVNGVFKLAYTQRLGNDSYDQSYPASLTTPLGAGLHKVTCSLAATMISATISVTPPSERRVCGEAPAITVQDVSVNGHPVVTQAIMDSHCAAGYALLGLGVFTQHSKSQPSASQNETETVWARNSPTSQILTERKSFGAVNSGHRSLAPGDPDFGKPNPGISRQQIAKVVESLSETCSAVLSLYDGNDAATLAPTKLVESELSRMDLHVDRITASIEKSPAHALAFLGQSDATLAWHGDLFSEPFPGGANGTWLYLPASKYVGWDSVLFRIYFNEQEALTFKHGIYVADRSITPNVAVCPQLEARVAK